MDIAAYLQYAKAALVELWRFRYLSMLTAFVIALCGLLIGYFWQEKYLSSATIVADQTNIITPLLRGQAEATRLQNQLQIVRDTLRSKEALDVVVREAGLLVGNESSSEINAKVGELRRTIAVRSLGKNYIGVSYQADSPDVAFRVVSRLVEEFIKSSSENKRSESRQAFDFIDKQVEAYRSELRSAEQKLKDFNASNVDGTERQAQQSIEALKRDIELVELDLEQSGERVQSLREQVEQEDRYLSEKARSDVYNERIVQAVGQLDDLRLLYTDSHPDVIAMQEHILALQKASASSTGESFTTTAGTAVENPVYDELRSALAAASVEKDAVERRLRSLRQRLKEGKARLSRVVARNAELTELTRDYEVTKNVYNDMLGRKEQARLSMTLDIEGQGLTYKVQTPANYPGAPNGLTYLHFVVLGCLVAAVVPLVLAVAYVLLDPRLRFSNVIQQEFDVPLLAAIPHYNSSLTARLNRSDARVFLFWLVFVGAVYSALMIAGWLLR